MGLLKWGQGPLTSVIDPEFGQQFMGAKKEGVNCENSKFSSLERPTLLLSVASQLN